MNRFIGRHIGPNNVQTQSVLNKLGFDSLNGLTSKVVPQSIVRSNSLKIGTPMSERDALAKIRTYGEMNQVHKLKPLLGAGFHGVHTPPVIQRNILENPNWYTAYTPYQAEISQGRLEAQYLFQEITKELTGLDVANASLLDESSATTEAVNLANNFHKGKRKVVYADRYLNPQTIEVLQTRLTPLGLTVREMSMDEGLEHVDDNVLCVISAYPNYNGDLQSASTYRKITQKAREAGALSICVADILALSIIKSPAQLGFDIATGTAQRLGVQPGYGGPAPAYFAVRDEFKRLVPGRIVGKSRDSQGTETYRLTLQTREQHIKREKATSNVCTSQSLLANMVAFYGVYNGPHGLQEIANSIHAKAHRLGSQLLKQGNCVVNRAIFDTVSVDTDRIDELTRDLLDAGFMGRANGSVVTMSVDETVSDAQIDQLIDIFSKYPMSGKICGLTQTLDEADLVRTDSFMEEDVFSRYQTETKLKRYMKSLEDKDITLTRSMIPLGSCTMKLNSASELAPVSWESFANPHPLQPMPGYDKLVADLERDLGDITGLPAVSLQPNSGAQGEFTGLMMIRKYLGPERDICLIPSSAHGTNPASCIQAGMRPVPVALNPDGSISLDDLSTKCREHKNKLACLMITYPSTYGIFDDNVNEVCGLIHKYGGQVYMDGANMNAQIGLTSPGTIGADVCHLNLHKTLCIPHGGGGPGVGPVCAQPHLEELLPEHTCYGNQKRTNSVGPVTSAPYGNAGVLPITWMYIKMMGSEGLKLASQTAIANANYLATRMEESDYRVLYKNKEGLVGHEFILDVSPYKKFGITEVDIAKRLMDHGYHAPTMSWPVPSSLMIEPTESEDLDELERFTESMASIRAEIREIENGRVTLEKSPLRNAPHTHQMVTADVWSYSYPRSQAAYPVDRLRENKYWPSVGRVDDAYGDRLFMKRR